MMHSVIHLQTVEMRGRTRGAVHRGQMMTPGGVNEVCRMISLSSVEIFVWFGEDAGSGLSSGRARGDQILPGLRGMRVPTTMDEAESYPTSPAVSAPNDGKPAILLS